jgi:ketosteroid isomerase-like protein
MRWRLSLLPLLAAACSSETVGPPPEAPVNWQSLQSLPVVDSGAEVTTARERALAYQYALALASPGLADLGPLLDEDVHCASPGMGDANGRGPAVGAHERLFGAFDDRNVVLSRVWRTPNEQTVEWVMTGIHARDYMGVPSTRKQVAFKGLTLLWTKDDGSVTDMHVYVDVAVVRAQLGVGPKDLLALPQAVPPRDPAEVFEQAQVDSEDKPDDERTSPSRGRNVNVALVQSALDALENDNEAAYVGAMTDDVELHALEQPRPSIGKREARLYYTAIHRAIGQLDTTTENAWGVARFALVEYSIAGEQMAPIGWVPAQPDKVIRLQVVDIAEIRDGKIARVWRYDNPAQIARRMDPTRNP